jgi:hypothetical protein
MARSVSESFPSRFLKADDLKGRRRSVVISRVDEETVGQGRDAQVKPVVYFRGTDTKPMVCNKTNGYAIAAVAGSEDYDSWPGVRVTLYPTTTNSPSGGRVACVRVEDPGADVLDTPLPTEAEQAAILAQLKASGEAG